MQVKTALITGVNGMDGSHLADLLLSKGYKVFGLERRSSTKNRTNTSHLEGKVTFVNGDLTDQNSLLRCMKEADPDEVYNLASQSFVGESWNTPEQTSDVTGLGVLRMLEAIREYGNPIKFYQASTSEMFGRMENFANENTRFYPRSPYGVAKLYAYWIIVNYREAYDLFACNGILFNHESPRRGETFVTRKITRAAARIKQNLQEELFLGNLDAKRDWGYAPEYVEGMWLMLQEDKPDDFILATGESHTIREFVELTFKELDIQIGWEGSGLNEIGVNAETGQKIVGIDKNYFRPTEVNELLGDPQKAKLKLNWKPKTKFKEIVKIMVRTDLEKVIKRGF